MPCSLIQLLTIHFSKNFCAVSEIYHAIQKKPLSLATTDTSWIKGFEIGILLARAMHSHSYINSSSYKSLCFWKLSFPFLISSSNQLYNSSLMDFEILLICVLPNLCAATKTLKVVFSYFNNEYVFNINFFF